MWITVLVAGGVWVALCGAFVLGWWARSRLLPVARQRGAEAAGGPSPAPLVPVADPATVADGALQDRRRVVLARHLQAEARRMGGSLSAVAAAAEAEEMLDQL